MVAASIPPSNRLLRSRSRAHSSSSESLDVICVICGCFFGHHYSFSGYGPLVTEPTPLIDIRNVIKEYGALRPLRIRELIVRPSEIVSVSGLDARAAEMLITLVTGASLPDTGEVQLLGRSTAEIGDSAAWLQSLDGIGMLSGRVVLLESYSIRQNIALSLTLDVDPLEMAVQERADALGREAGIDAGLFDTPIGRLGADVQMRVRLARALALQPTLLLAEHPSANVPSTAVGALASDLSRIARSRAVGLLAITADPVFARALGGDSLALDPATGAWRSKGLWQKVSNVIRR
jgi:lipoprotein-releasing system ATP-binding protein